MNFSSRISRVVAPVAAVAAILFAAAPAEAHTVLVASTPEAGSTVTDIAVVRLEFSEDLLEIGTNIHVVDADDVDYVFGAAAVTGRIATASVGTLAPGEYTITWRVVSEDGHPVEGAIPFTVAPADPQQPTGTEEEPAGADPSASPVLVGVVTPSPSASASSAPDSGVGEGDGATRPPRVDRWMAIVAGLAGAGAVVALTVRWLAARRRG